MAEVSNELMHELMKSTHQRMDRTASVLGEIKQELVSLRLSVMGIQTDTHNIYGILASHDDRLERIERHLDLREFAETQRPFDPT